MLGAVRKAVKDSVRDEGHAGDGESGENFRGDFFKDNPIASAATYQSDHEAFFGTVRWSVQLRCQRQRRLAAPHLRVQLRLLHTAPNLRIGERCGERIRQPSVTRCIFCTFVEMKNTLVKVTGCLFLSFSPVDGGSMGPRRDPEQFG